MLGVLLLLGGISAWYVLGGRRDGTVPGPSLPLAAIGAMLLVAAGITGETDSFRSAAEVLLPILTLGTFALGLRRDSGALILLAAVFGAELIGLEVAYSHAADEPGLLPIIGNALHWVIATAWAGAAVHLATARWTTSPAASAAAVASLTRYARVSGVGITVAAATGGILGFVHVHNADALAATGYGAVYQAKLVTATVLVPVFVFLQLRIAELSRADTEENVATGIPRCVRLLRIEAGLLTIAVVLAGVMAAKAPPGLAPFLNPQTWEVSSDDIALAVELQPVSGQLSRARLEISPLGDAGSIPDGTIVTVSLARPGDGVAGRALEALPVGPSEFLAETVIPMPGAWKLDILLETPTGETLGASRLLEIPGPPLARDMRAYLSAKTIGYHGANLTTFIVGLLLLAAAAWIYRQGLRGRVPAWLIISGSAGAALGGLLVLSVSFVKTYPSSFWDNPVPYTRASIQEGDALYREHCAECHGLTGRGDGPWALENRGGALPDLTSPHMDTHTDGEIYWWIKHGIPSLDMPAYGNKMTDQQNWTVINFMRSLRHGMPPEQ